PLTLEPMQLGLVIPFAGGVRHFQFPIQQLQGFINFASPFTADGKTEQMHSSGYGCMLGNGTARASKSLRGLAFCTQNPREADLGQPGENRVSLLPGEGCQFRQTLNVCRLRTTQLIDERSPRQCNGQCIWVVCLSG